MILSYKYRAYPKGEVEAKAASSIDAARYVYNWGLERFGDGRNGKIPSQAQLMRELTLLKKEQPFLNKPYSHMLQRTIQNLYNNTHSLHSAKNMGRRVGRLRFKNSQRFKSIRYNSQGYEVDRKEHTVSLAKIGTIKFEMHREVPEQIDGVILKRSGDKWYVIFQCEMSDTPERIDEDKIIALDVGVRSFVYDSEGHVVGNPKFLARRLGRLKFLQRELSRKQNGSNNRQKARTLVARIHEKVKNIRNNRNHQVSRKYVNAYDVVVVEDLNILGMMDRQRKIRKMASAARKTLRRNIHDAAWGDFIRKLEYKAEGAGKRVIRVEANNTTQACSNCGNIVYKDITKRIHECLYCGFVLDRDENATKNILLKGLTILRAGNRPEPAEEGINTA
jgi:putative transposase